MKTILLFFLLIFCYESNSLPFEDGFTYTVIDSSFRYNYWDVSCINNDECLFLAKKGLNGAIIYKTIDGGKTRRIVYEDTATIKNGSIDYIPDYEARNIFYFESGIAIVVAYYGVFLKSTDFGETWKKYKSEYYLDVLDVEVVNENLAFIVTDKIPKWDDEVYYSTDGCETWNLFPVPDSIRSKVSPFSLSAQKNGDLLIGYFSKPDVENWYMYKTNLEGTNWELINTPPNTYHIHYISESEWITRGVILNIDKKYEFVTAYKTWDAGKSWDLKFKSEPPFSEAYISIFSESFNTGYILGPKNLILKTKDKGDNWYFIKDSLAYLGLTSSITGACLPSDNVLFYTTTMLGRIVKYSSDPARVVEPLALTSKIYPNPIHNGSNFTVDYEISESGIIKQYICDLGGREICELLEGYKEIGQYSYTYSLPENFVSGSYWLVTEMNGVCQIKMLNVVN